jgi:periplasmic mercuric ion binding protein
MKTKKLVIVVLFAFLISGISANAQNQGTAKTANSKTETIKVQGACGMCKTRIEKAAKVEGVSKADWDKTTKILTLVYDPSKVNSDDVQKKIATVGHDTEKYTADQKVYDSLPGCCKYR